MYCHYAKLRVPLKYIKDFCDFAYFCQNSSKDEIE